MCGIFGGVSGTNHSKEIIFSLARDSRRRGRDASGLIWSNGQEFMVERSTQSISGVVQSVDFDSCLFFAGHSRLITSGHSDNQPVEFQSVWTLHNGIVLNDQQVWNQLGLSPRKSVDSEVLSAFVYAAIMRGESLAFAAQELLSVINGVVSAVIVVPELGQALLVSNNGSLYIGYSENSLYFASESFSLQKIGLRCIEKVDNSLVIEIPKSYSISVADKFSIKADPNPSLAIKDFDDLLVFDSYDLRRCSKCILPETMPYITFNEHGICNYCENYSVRNSPKALFHLQEIVDKYSIAGKPSCIFPFSGGRDSSFGLHLAVNELGLQPITYTYDWGMVTDLARRNISLMCSKLKVENIIVAADIDLKRRNIRNNLLAWLKHPHLGMISLLTAGDKHFFRYIEDIKRENDTKFNLWSVNPLEVTHFKTGFLGIPPDFENKRVYQSGLSKQIEYQTKRFVQMIRNPSYWNSSIVDTLSGEYFRSRKKDHNYHHLFDYYRWDEIEINGVLREYGWETASDTSSTWRIGDGTAAFYNYVYYRVAGFTEHDTFRSNQIREGQLKREEALRLVEEENQPRYPNIKWYLDVLGLDFTEVISRVNNIPRLKPN